MRLRHQRHAEKLPADHNREARRCSPACESLRRAAHGSRYPAQRIDPSRDEWFYALPANLRPRRTKARCTANALRRSGRWRWTLLLLPCAGKLSWSTQKFQIREDRDPEIRCQDSSPERCLEPFASPHRIKTLPAGHFLRAIAEFFPFAERR